MQKMFATIRTHYHNLSAKGGSLYRRAIDYAGLEDCPEARITAAVVVSVALYYVCAAIQTIVNIVTDAAPMLTALLT